MQQWVEKIQNILGSEHIGVFFLKIVKTYAGP